VVIVAMVVIVTMCGSGKGNSSGNNVDSVVAWLEAIVTILEVVWRRK
jgi:hypothetical protein